MLDIVEFNGNVCYDKAKVICIMKRIPVLIVIAAITLLSLAGRRSRYNRYSQCGRRQGLLVQTE